MKQTFSLRALVVFGALAASPSFAGDIEINIPNAGDKGQIRAALYASQEAFDSDKTHAVAKATPKNGAAQLTFSGLAEGTYGIALYQDENGDKKLGRNLFGAPTEPYGFSSNPVIKMRAPSFEEFSFKHTGGAQSLTITLNGG